MINKDSQKFSHLSPKPKAHKQDGRETSHYLWLGKDRAGRHGKPRVRILADPVLSWSRVNQLCPPHRAQGSRGSWQAGTIHTSLDTSTGPWGAALFAGVRPQGVKVLRHSDRTRIHLPEPPALRDWERGAQHEPLGTRLFLWPHDWSPQLHRGHLGSISDAPGPVSHSAALDTSFSFLWVTPDKAQLCSQHISHLCFDSQVITALSLPELGFPGVGPLLRAWWPPIVVLPSTVVAGRQGDKLGALSQSTASIPEALFLFRF